MNFFFGRHRVRATFYHTVSLIFIVATILWMGGLLGDKASFIVTAVLFVVDYLAEMYDPHPENPGPWFKTHFHRFLHPTDEDEEFDRWFHCKDIEHIFERD